MIVGRTHLKCFNFLKNKNREFLNLLATVQNIRGITEENKLRLYESVFLKIFINFEGYIESSFICYLMGKKSKDGYKPRLKLRFNSIDDAYNWIYGKHVRKTEYIEWSDLKFVKEKAKLFWGDDENPYDRLLGNFSIFKHIKTIRNSVAHLSRYHHNSLEKVEEHFFTTTNNRSAGEILSEDYGDPPKPLIYHIHHQFMINAEVVQKDPS